MFCVHPAAAGSHISIICQQESSERVSLDITLGHHRPFPQVRLCVMVVCKGEGGVLRALVRRDAADAHSETGHGHRFDGQEPWVHSHVHVMLIEIDKQGPDAVVYELSMPRDGAREAHGGTECNKAAGEWVCSAWHV